MLDKLEAINQRYLEDEKLINTPHEKNDNKSKEQ